MSENPQKQETTDKLNDKVQAAKETAKNVADAAVNKADELYNKLPLDKINEKLKGKIDVKSSLFKKGLGIALCLVFLLVVLRMLFSLCGGGGYEPEEFFDIEIFGKNAAITGYNGTAMDVKIPPMIGGRKVKAIAKKAFLENNGLTSVIIPSSVEEIGINAFTNCYALTSITIPNSVKIIKQLAFANCTSLTKITIPSSVITIEEDAFKGCTGLTSVTIPKGVEEIGEAAFNECSSLAKVIIPNSVKVIGAYAFANCPKLDNVTLPSDIKQISRGTFSNCSGLTSIKIPSNIKLIGSYAFHRTGLTSVKIPSGVTIIKAGTFEDCSRLIDINLPNSVEEIGYQAFYGCNSLKKIVIPKMVKVIDENAFSNTGLTNVSIPNTVTNIEKLKFPNNCKVTRY